ncbi:MAG: oxygenase MpaB family protein [Acidimicrobiia bacterium]
MGEDDIRAATQIRMLSMRCVRAISRPPVARAALHVPGSVLTPVRDALGGAIRGLLGGGERTPDFEFAGVDDPGLFGPDSVVWRVHADRSMLVGGVRALFLQVMHPLAMAGVAQHSAYREDPLGRLARTGRFIAATTYGTTAEAEASISVVRRVHEHVRGFTSDGRPYAATDPALLAWVHNVEVESFLEAYRRYGPGLDDADADRYVAEMAIIGRRLGAADVPETAPELAEWIAGVPDLEMTREAREAVRFLVLPPLPPPVLPAYLVLAAAAAGLLPLRNRLALGLWPLPFADPLVVRPATSTMLAVLGWALGPPPTPVFEAA